MAQKFKELILLTRPEITLIHYIASQPGVMSKMGFTAAQLTPHVNYGATIVKVTLTDLVVLGLAKQDFVPRESVGRRSHLYTFHHPTIQKLSEHYKRIENFTMRNEERALVPVMNELLIKGFTSLDQIETLSKIPNVEQLLYRNRDTFARRGFGEILQYGLTEEGKAWTNELISIQAILSECTNQYINKT